MVCKRVIAIIASEIQRDHLIVCKGRLEVGNLGVYVLPHWDFLKPGVRDSEYHWSLACGGSFLVKFDATSISKWE